MLPEVCPQRNDLLRNSSTSGFVWEQFDFDICNNFEVGRYTWACISLLCFTVGFPATLVILWRMSRMCRGGTVFTPNDLFILHLTIMDVGFLAFLPIGLLNHFYLKVWAIEALWNLVYSLNTLGRPFLMACVCFDCYLAVVHPIFYHKNKSLTPRFVAVGVVWTLTAANGLTFFLFYRLFFSFFPAVTYSVPIVIIGVCDGVIVYKLVKSDPVGKRIHPQKQRAIQTLIYSLAMTAISYLPPVIFLSVGRPLAGSFNVFVCAIGFPINITSTLGSTFMPVLYLYNVGTLNCARLRCCKH
ncbi:G-protein coupled receptor 1-like [Kryptolebias marmoratus]|uniref:G-protein coupled receptor 1-like n=1 Tax=Kryptolebias marmoratus TaxID=37003 RepID=UPI0007F91E1F|nr:G-protein coupled receptor 1-like [Kryptolebias marmoratus]